MRVTRLGLTDFRSYSSVDVEFDAGVTALVGPNGQGKTNLVEAVEYVATQVSHRVATDAPLVRTGAERAIVRAAVTRDDRQALLEIEITPGRANRARLNRSPLTRARDLLGVLRLVVFSPDDTALVRGEPAERRRFVDELLTARQPRYAAVRGDYDRVLRQRNSLLRSAAGRIPHRAPQSLGTLDAWDDQLARHGAELLAGRLALVDELRPPLQSAYEGLASGGTAAAKADLDYRASWRSADLPLDRAELAAVLLDELQARRTEEVDRGVTLVGPHRDDIDLRIGDLPARGYASQGESWSMALALRLASFELLRAGSDDPVLVLDDVFAELDAVRRNRLADIVAATEQVLVTAAVEADVPTGLAGSWRWVSGGTVS